MNVQCPHCSKPLQVKSVAEYNANAYRQPVLAVTLCCGKGVTLTPVRSVSVTAYKGPKDQDDWGFDLAPWQDVSVNIPACDYKIDMDQS